MTEMISPDTHRIVKNLVPVGFSQHQAETLVEQIAMLIKDLATKADLENLATKSDLKHLATKADLEKYRAEGRNETQTLRLEVEKVRSEVEKVRSEGRENVQVLRQEMKDLKSGLLMWMAGIVIAVVVAVAAIAGLP